MRTIATMTALMAALLAAPAIASAETVAGNGGKLNYISEAGHVDVVEVTVGTGASAGKHVLRESASPSLVPSGQCATLTADSVACSSVGSVFLTTLDRDDIVVVAVPLSAWVDAGPGNDTVTGGSSADTLIGGDGNDSLTAAGGFDWVYGGGGDDHLDTRDGGADWVDCGAGTDSVSADPDDAVFNCEGAPIAGEVADDQLLPVTQSPDSKPASAKPTGAKPVATKPGAGDASTAAESGLPIGLEGPVGLVQAFAPVVAGHAAVGLTCAAETTEGCAGVAYLDPMPVAGKGKKAKRAKARAAAALRKGRYGKSSFVIAAGKSKNLKVTLTPAARRALGLPVGKRARAARKGRKVKAVVTVQQRGRAAARSVLELRG